METADFVATHEEVYSPSTAGEFVYRGLRRMLMAGELLPGDRLVQTQLAKRFGTSSIPVLEATRRLEQDGLLISQPNRGAQVPTWKPIDIEAAFLVRESLEAIACRLFVQHASDQDKRKLRELSRDFDDKARAGDARGWCDADVALHLHIVRATGANILVRSIENSCAITLTIHNAHILQGAAQELIPQEGLHNELVSALLSGDATRAEETGRAYVVEARNDVMRMMQSRGCEEGELVNSTIP